MWPVGYNNVAGLTKSIVTLWPVWFCLRPGWL